MPWQAHDQCLRAPLIDQLGNRFPVRLAIAGGHCAQGGGCSGNALTDGNSYALFAKIEAQQRIQC
jgi:hypothetical protein